MELSERQHEAVALCLDLSKRIVSVTGPAGTGKTTILRTIYEKFAAQLLTVAVVAPTGKAAKRIREATGLPAKTIHQLLEYAHPGPPTPEKPIPESPGPARRRSYPLTQDVVIVDEFSMVNNTLYRHLIDALKPGSLLRCFGDINQLSPIEDSSLIKTPDADTISPFQNILNRFPKVVLDTYFRQADGSMILENAHRVLKRRPPIKGPNFNIHFTDNPIQFLLDKFDLQQFYSMDTQIICPVRNAQEGTDLINTEIQERISAPKDTFYIDYEVSRYTKAGKKIIKTVRRYQGDKVIMNENIYDLDPENSTKPPVPIDMQIFNGELGTITSFIGENIQVDLQDRVVTIPYYQDRFSTRNGQLYVIDPREKLDLGFAITTHKAQGSEYKHIIYLLTKSCSWLVNWRNTYTALTRARESVTIISPHWVFNKITNIPREEQ